MFRFVPFTFAFGRTLSGRLRFHSLNGPDNVAPAGALPVVKCGSCNHRSFVATLNYAEGTQLIPS